MEKRIGAVEAQYNEDASYFVQLREFINSMASQVEKNNAKIDFMHQNYTKDSNVKHFRDEIKKEIENEKLKLIEEMKNDFNAEEVQKNIQANYDQSRQEVQQLFGNLDAALNKKVIETTDERVKVLVNENFQQYDAVVEKTIIDKLNESATFINGKLEESNKKIMEKIQALDEEVRRDGKKYSEANAAKFQYIDDKFKNIEGKVNEVELKSKTEAEEYKTVGEKVKDYENKVQSLETEVRKDGKNFSDAMQARLASLEAIIAADPDAINRTARAVKDVGNHLQEYIATVDGKLEKFAKSNEMHVKDLLDKIKDTSEKDMKEMTERLNIFGQALETNDRQLAEKVVSCEKFDDMMTKRMQLMDDILTGYLQDASKQVEGVSARLHEVEILAQTQASLNNGKEPCHCQHVDELSQRVETLEKSMLENVETKTVNDRSSNDPFQSAQCDAWGRYRPTMAQNTSFSACPIGRSVSSGVCFDGNSVNSCRAPNDYNNHNSNTPGSSAQPCGSAGIPANSWGYPAGGGTSRGTVAPQQSPQQPPQETTQAQQPQWNPQHDTGHMPVVYREIRDAHRVFDKQVARSDPYQTDGITGCHAWVKRTKNHLIGCIGDLEPLLQWAEQQGIRPITTSTIIEMASQHRLIHDPLETSAYLWSWLGQCCIAGKSSETTYNLGERRNGFDAWRRLSLLVRDASSLSKLELLKDKSRNPTAAKLPDLRVAFDGWETDLREYLDMGGDVPSDREKRMCLLKIVPMDYREGFLTRMHDIETFEAYRNFILNRADELIYIRGGKSGAHLAENEDEDEELLIAKLERRGMTINRRGPPRQTALGRGGASGPPSRFSVRASCINCGSKEHATSACPRPRVEPKDRPCFKCGKKGHTASACPSSLGDQAKALEDDEPKVLVCTRVDEEGYRPTRNGVRPKLTLGDFVLPTSNSFKLIERSGERSRVPTDEPALAKPHGGTPMLKLTGADDSTTTSHKPPRHPNSRAKGTHFPQGTPARNAKCTINGPDLNSFNHNSFPKGGSSERYMVQRCTLCEWRGVPERPGWCPDCFTEGTLTPSQTVPSQTVPSQTVPSQTVLSQTVPGAQSDGAQSDGSGCPGTLGENVPYPPPPSSTTRPPSRRRPTPLYSAPCQCERPDCITTNDDDDRDAADMEHMYVRLTPEMAQQLGMATYEGVNIVEEDMDDDIQAAMNAEEFREVDLVCAGDSGCADHIANMSDLPGYHIKESAGSKAGKGWVAADGMRILNEGEAELNLASQGRMKSTFQVGKVSRPLMSIARICDAGNTVLFNKTHAIVRDSKGAEVCKFDRKGQLYLIKFRLKAPDSGFARPGR